MARYNARKSSRTRPARKVKPAAGVTVAAVEQQPDAGTKAQGILDKIDAAFGLGGETQAGSDAGAGEAQEPVGNAQGTLSPELQALADEAATASPLADEPKADAAPAPATGDGDQIPIGQLTHIIAPGVAVVGNFACDAFRVSRLETIEVRALAESICRVADAYNVLGQLDPRSAAWLGLAATVAGVAMNRRGLAPQPEPEVAAAREASGDAATE